MASTCPTCACPAADDGGAHALQAMLGADDLDAALEHGLLEARPCPGCTAACTARLLAAREQRRVALAARARFQARAARLARRKAERAAARAPAAASPAKAPALPAAAADVLARALAKAAQRASR